MSDISFRKPIFSKSNEIIVYPRIHMFSLDLSLKNGNLKSGSVGFSLLNFPVRISVGSSSETEICSTDLPKNLSKEILNTVREFNLRNNINKEYKIKISIPNNSRHHTGLGLTTQILGGVLVCLYGINDLGFDIDYFLDYGIGEVSALGVNLIANPGFIIEFGYKISSKGKNIHPELYDMKENFEKNIISFGNLNIKAIIAIPKELNSLSGKLEEEFWGNIFPDKEDNSKDVVYWTFINLISSLERGDFEGFISVMNKITKTGTKPLEEDVQSHETKEALRIMKRMYGFAGVSSLGPTIYSFAKDKISQPKIKNFEIIEIEL